MLHSQRPATVYRISNFTQVPTCNPTSFTSSHFLGLPQALLPKRGDPASLSLLA